MRISLLKSPHVPGSRVYASLPVDSATLSGETRSLIFSRDFMTNTHELGPAGKLTLTFFLVAIFLDIAILPYYLYMDFAPDSKVYMAVGGTTAVLAIGLWLATAFGPLKTR